MKTLDQFLNERLGGKGYKPYTSLTGKKVSGDWEDSDRGAGNKAKKRAGGKVEKKSPTYKAHVLNKESAVLDANTKISNKEKRDKMKKELDTLTKRAKAWTKHGSGYHPFLHREGEDKAFNYVVAKLRKQHGKDAVITKDNPIKPPTAAQKAKVAAHKAKLAKQDHRDPTEKASDGRYSDRYSNRGSD